MVAHGLSDDDADRIFQALADRTRRDIVTRVLTSEQSVSELAERYSMSFAAVQKHVAVLERAGLVRKVRRGREQIVHAEVDVIHQARSLLERFERLWQHRVARIDALLTEHDATQGD
ncbi:ArsR/SmtB family transcription factor [Pseudactinotalea sp.]|uniref:ArsR/SmtB family transcription factor n=1 Tax=Pseudactinotalea sp. TaxID=1926260 RepID=UPI003B3A0BF0